MDYESKILLNKLIEAVGNLGSPDWWVIGLTFVNTIAVVVIACIQIKLQRRQTDSQEYELYRNLARTIKEIHFEIKFVMWEFFRYLNNEIPIPDENVNYWSLNIKKFNELRRQLEDYEIDIELKFSKKTFIDIESYKSAVQSTIFFCSLCKSLFLNNEITKGYYPESIEKPYNEVVEQLSAQVSEYSREHFRVTLYAFLIAKDNINEEETMQKIKNRCKID